MKHLKPPKSTLQNVQQQISLELLAWRNLIGQEWPLVLVFVLIVSVLFIYARPTPPKTIGMAVGQVGTSSAIYGSQLVNYFKEHGVTLNLTHTAETNATVDTMIDQGDIDSALLLGGTYNKGDIKNVVSLGSVQYEPFWLFYRGDQLNIDSPLEYFSDKRFAIGLPGTASYHILAELLASRGVSILSQPNLVELSYQDAAQALIENKIDAMAIVSGIDAPVIQSLINNPDIRISNFPLAAAYIKKLPHLDLVSIPRGSLNLKEIHPDAKIDMVSATLNIVVEKELHPAIQLLFLMAADHFGDSKNQFFSRPDEFPSHKDQTIPLSDVAKSYFGSGPPRLLHYAPFWLASLVDRMWVLIIGLLAVGYPLYKMLPNYRSVHTHNQIAAGYGSLREAEEEIRNAKSIDEFARIEAYLIGLEKEISSMNISDSDLSRYFGLLAHISIVKKLLGDTKASWLPNK